MRNWKTGMPFAGETCNKRVRKILEKVFIGSEVRTQVEFPNAY